MLPTEPIDLPRPEDFCKKVFHDGHGCHCTTGWRMVLFQKLNVQETVRFQRVWHRAANKVGIPLVYFSGMPVVSARNDHPDTTLEQLAAAFEMAVVEAFDYEVYER